MLLDIPTPWHCLPVQGMSQKNEEQKNGMSTKNDFKMPLGDNLADVPK